MLIAVGVGSLISIVLGLAVSTGEPDPPRFSLDWFAAGIREGGLVFTAALLTVPSLALFALFLPDHRAGRDHGGHRADASTRSTPSCGTPSPG